MSIFILIHQRSRVHPSFLESVVRQVKRMVEKLLVILFRIQIPESFLANVIPELYRRMYRRHWQSPIDICCIQIGQ